MSDAENTREEHTLAEHIEHEVEWIESQSWKGLSDRERRSIIARHYVMVIEDHKHQCTTTTLPSAENTTREKIAAVVHEARLTWVGGGDGDYDRTIADALIAAFPTLIEDWEYGWEADETIRQTMNPRGPKILVDGTIDTPEGLARFPKGKRIRRRKAGKWEEYNE